MFCEVRMRFIHRSGYFVLADGVTPDVAAQIIAAQPSTPGVVVWRVDHV